MTHENQDFSLRFCTKLSSLNFPVKPAQTLAIPRWSTACSVVAVAPVYLMDSTKTFATKKHYYYILQEAKLRKEKTSKQA